MFYRVSADLVVLVHLAFVLFAVFGAFLVVRSRRWIWIHVPTVCWATLIEWVGWVCPLTPLEKWLRQKGGLGAYRGGFIEHYILPLLYPAGLTRPVQVGLGVFVLGFNVAIYLWIWRRAVRTKHRTRR